MSDEILSVSARCRDDASCRYRGEDIFIAIDITNRQAAAVGFPLAYLQKTGPIVRLIDTESNAETNLKRNLADHALKSSFTAIPPGGSATLEWVITGEELEQFPGRRVDVTAEITLLAEIRTDAGMKDFRGSATLHIVSADEETR